MKACCFEGPRVGSSAKVGPCLHQCSVARLLYDNGQMPSPFADTRRRCRGHPQLQTKRATKALPLPRELLAHPLLRRRLTRERRQRRVAIRPQLPSHSPVTRLAISRFLAPVLNSLQELWAGSLGHAMHPLERSFRSFLWATAHPSEQNKRLRKSTPSAEHAPSPALFLLVATAVLLRFRVECATPASARVTADLASAMVNWTSILQQLALV